MSLSPIAHRDSLAPVRTHDSVGGVLLRYFLFLLACFKLPLLRGYPNAGVRSNLLAETPFLLDECEPMESIGHMGQGEYCRRVPTYAPRGDAAQDWMLLRSDESKSFDGKSGGNDKGFTSQKQLLSRPETGSGFGPCEKGLC
jgi:hypothetical protein